MRNAQRMMITSQKMGSRFAGITNTVAMAMAKPNRDNLKISFQSIAPPLETPRIWARSYASPHFNLLRRIS